MSKRDSSKASSIDFVIPWVDGEDPEWVKARRLYESPGDRDDIGRAADIRFRSWDNLQYWFRGVEQFAPWVRTIHFVTWGHLPAWLNTSHPKLHIVKHQDYIPSKYLPTFSSHVIEWNFHRIEGLSETFVYFNDDMFLLDSVEPDDFFTSGRPRDSFSMNAITLAPTSTMSPMLYNTWILNRHFSKKSVLRRNMGRLLSPRNRSEILRTLLLIPWPRITGITEPHLATNLLKSTYLTLWDLEYDLLDKVCSHKFRDPMDVSQWLIRDWQLCSGMSLPRSSAFGKRYIQNIDDEIVDCIRHQRYRMACFNDNATEESFEKEKELLRSAFETILPQRSSFELP